MSYDISIHLAGTAEDPDPPPLGTRKHVFEVLQQRFPALQWGEASWGEYADGSGSAEFNVGDEDPIKSFAVHLRGNFVAILEQLDAMAVGNGWEIFDWQGAPEEIDPEEFEELFREYGPKE